MGKVYKKKYSVTMHFNVLADNIEDAKKEINEIKTEMDKQYDNNPFIMNVERV